jgi:hypothetical protein
MFITQLLLVLALLIPPAGDGAGLDPHGGLRVRSDEGNGLDPHGGRKAGWGIDPNGYQVNTDDGSGLDPHGRT